MSRTWTGAGVGRSGVRKRGGEIRLQHRTRSTAAGTDESSFAAGGADPSSLTMSRPQHETKPQTFTRQRRLVRDQGLTDLAVANAPAAQGLQVEEGHPEVVAVCSRGRYVIEVG